MSKRQCHLIKDSHFEFLNQTKIIEHIYDQQDIQWVISNVWYISWSSFSFLFVMFVAQQTKSILKDTLEYNECDYSKYTKSI